MAFLRGTVDRVEPPNEHGWAKIFVTADGHEKPVRLDTRDEPKIREALELRDARAFVAIEYDEQSKYDNRTGRSYLNRYWKRAARTGNGSGFNEPPRRPDEWTGFAGAPQEQQPVRGGEGYGVITPAFNPPTPEVGRPTNPRDAWRMSLAKACELAIASTPYLPVEQRTPQNQKEIALFWARFIYFTEPSLSTIVDSDAAWPAAGEQAPWPGDADIPF